MPRRDPALDGDRRPGLRCEAAGQAFSNTSKFTRAISSPAEGKLSCYERFVEKESFRRNIGDMVYAIASQ